MLEMCVQCPKLMPYIDGWRCGAGKAQNQKCVEQYAYRFYNHNPSKGVPMSHTVNIKLIANQEIEVLGQIINIDDIETILLNSNGKIESVFCRCEKCKTHWNIHSHESDIKFFRKE